MNRCALWIYNGLKVCVTAMSLRSLCRERHPAKTTYWISHNYPLGFTISLTSPFSTRTSSLASAMFGAVGLVSNVTICCRRCSFVSGFCFMVFSLWLSGVSPRFGLAKNYWACGSGASCIGFLHPAWHYTITTCATPFFRLTTITTFVWFTHDSLS